MSPTDTIVSWIEETRQRPLPAAVEEQVRRSLRDYLACVAAGSDSSIARTVRSWLAETDFGDRALVVGGGRASAAGAAFANGTSAHCLELDDGYTKGSVHPSAVVVSAALAAGQSHAAPPTSVQMAIALGTEVTCRVAEAGHPATRRQGFHNTAIAGVIGAAVGAGVAIGLSPEQLRQAIALATSFSGGLFAFLQNGADVKRIHPGKAARDGVVCAELAAKGLTGPKEPLVGTDGYFPAFASSGWSTGPLDALASPTHEWAMLETYFKRHASCRHVHSAVDAALQLRDDIEGGHKAIESVVVETYRVATLHDGLELETELGAQLSMPYSLSVALVAGGSGPEFFSSEWRQQPDVLRIAKLVEVRVGEHEDEAYPDARPATVTVTTGNSKHSLTVLNPAGEPANPMSDGQLRMKFMELATPTLGSGCAAEVSAAVDTLDLERLYSLLESEAPIRP